jgi:hypothetical protein
MANYKINPLDVSFEPLSGSTFINIIRLLAQNNFRISLIGIPRIVYSVGLSLILSPLSFYEKVKYTKKINNTKIEKPPIFIIGHWRSGTTYMHNLLSQDDSFAYPTTFQTVTPALFLRFEKQIKPIVASSLPPTRPQDHIKLGADLPQEEEYGVGNLSTHSYYHGWCFPKNRDFYYNCVHFDGVKEKRIEEWKKYYLFYLKKLTLYYNGKQLILKNPSNTGRVKQLLELFPDAKFIHIYRNPYHTFLSKKRNIEKEMTLYCIQKPDDEDTFEKAMAEMYNKMYDKYFNDKKLIPKENLVEIKYENLVKDPYNVVKKIYQDLNIPTFKNCETNLKKYIQTQHNIKTYKYSIDKKTHEKIYNYLNKTIDKWGYLE